MKKTILRRLISHRFALSQVAVLLSAIGVGVAAYGYALDHTPMSRAQCTAVVGGDYEDYAGPGFCTTTMEAWNCNQPDTWCLTGTPFCEENKVPYAFCFQRFEHYNPTRCQSYPHVVQECANDGTPIYCYYWINCHCHEEVGMWVCVQNSGGGMFVYTPRCRLK